MLARLPSAISVGYGRDCAMLGCVIRLPSRTSITAPRAGLTVHWRYQSVVLCRDRAQSNPWLIAAVVISAVLCFW
jgi:hypothetical protein